MTRPSAKARTRVKRLPQRAAYDRATINGILDEGLVAHIGFVDDGQPFVIPTLYARIGDQLYIHGSAASRMVKALAAGASACLTVSLLDGLVLARSALHHDVRYRSVVVLGAARLVEPTEERLAALEAFIEQMIPGRWWDIRHPSPQELKATRVLAFGLEQASAKLNRGPLVEKEGDYERETWAGHIPLRLIREPAVADERLLPGVSEPEYVRSWHA